METLNVASLRVDLSDCLSRVQWEKRSYLIEKHGKPVAVLLSTTEYYDLLKHRDGATSSS